MEPQIINSVKKFSTVFLLAFLASCYYDNEEELFSKIGNDCDTLNVTYAIEVEGIIVESCAISGCHVPSGTGNGNFLEYEGVKDKVDNGSFENRVILQKNMPPNGSLSACEIDQLKSWIGQGALNN